MNDIKISMSQNELNNSFCSKSTTKKIVISRYDESVKGAPYKIIKIAETEIIEPQTDFLGEIFCKALYDKCREMGYKFKFYTISSNPNYDYEVFVY
jgi:hypothetical protein